MTKDEALRLALEALEAVHTHGDVALVVTPNGAIYIQPAITAIKAALEAKDEPVVNTDHVICPNCVHQFRAIPQNVQKLMLASGFEPPFTTPPQRKPLMDEEILTYRYMIDWTAEWSYINFARAIEAAHGITGDNT